MSANEKGRTVTTFCRMCNDRCCINVDIKDGRIVRIIGNPDHPWNKGGRLCIKSQGAMETVYHPKRLRQPLKRTAAGFIEIPHEQALDEIAAKIKDIKSAHGAKSIGIWKGEAVGFKQQEDYARRFAHAFGTPNYLSNDSQCFVGKDIGHRLVDGVWAVPDYQHARYIVLWGTNPPFARPLMTQMILDAKNKGAKVVVVDPRLTEIARKADIFVQIKPGTDGAFAWGLINQIIENRWYDQNFVDNYTVGFDKLSVYAKKFNPQYVERETGVSATIVEEVAKGFAFNAPKSMNYVGNGLEHHQNGINNIRAIACIGAMCGCLDQKGGEFMPLGLGEQSLTLYDEIPLTHLEPLGTDTYPVLYDFSKECNTMMAMDSIISGKPYPLHAIIMTAANPALTNPNTDKVKKALAKLDLFVVHDLFLTETTEFADYVLPAATFLERTEIVAHPVFQWVGLAREVCRFPNCTSEYEFWLSLAQRLDMEKYFPWQNEEEVNKWLLESTDITYEQLEKNPAGLRYAPLAYLKYRQLEKPFKTPTGKIEFASQYLKDLGYEEIPVYKSPAYIKDPQAEYPYVLVSGARKHLFTHGRNRNIDIFKKAAPDPFAEIHPDDAESILVKDGDMICVTSQFGSLRIPAKVVRENEILPGVIQITHGYQEADVNKITADSIRDPIDGFPLMKSLMVKVEKILYPNG